MTQYSASFAVESNIMTYLVFAISFLVFMHPSDERGDRIYINGRNGLRKLPVTIPTGIDLINIVNGQIDVIPTNSFKYWINISLLSLVNNSIRHIEHHAFSKNFVLKHLFIHKNNIRELYPNGFCFLYQLAELDLSDNHISKAEACDKELDRSRIGWS